MYCSSYVFVVCRVPDDRLLVNSNSDALFALFVCDCAVDADVPLSDMLKTFN